MAHFWKQPLTYLAQSAGQVLQPLALRAMDGAIEVISPSWGQERRWHRALGAANSDAQVTELARLAANPRGAWRQASIGDTGSNESTRAQRERITTIWESRECMNNFGFLKMLALRYALYVVGRVHYQATTSDSGLNAIYEDYILEWFLNCDITGRFQFRKLMELAYIGMKVDGDSGIIVSLRENDLKLQLVQGDRIGNPFDYSYTEGYYSGVITDEVGAPAQYKIYKRTRNNVYIDPVPVERLNFCHVMNPMWMDQYRGLSTNDTAIAPARQIFNIIQNELRAVNALSGQTAIVGSKGNVAGAKWLEEQRHLKQEAEAKNIPAPQMPSQEIKPGTINYVMDGDNITAFTYNRPSPAFNGLMEFEFKEICDAWGADYNFFMGGGAKGANIRLGSSQMKRVFQGEQEVMETTALGPIIDLKLQYGMAVGDIPAHPEWRKKEFTYGAHATSDNGDDGALEIEQIKMGLLPLDEWLKRHEISNGQIDQHVSRLGKAASAILAEAKSVNAPVYMIQMRTPNGNEPGKEPEDGGGESTELANPNHDEKGRFATDDSIHGRFKSASRRARKIERHAHTGVRVAKDLHHAIRGYLDGRRASAARRGNFRMQEPRGKSIRVYYDPQKKGPRERRKKYFYEKVSFKRRVLRSLIAAGIVAAGLAAEASRRSGKMPDLKSKAAPENPPIETTPDRSEMPTAKGAKQDVAAIPLETDTPTGTTPLGADAQGNPRSRKKRSLPPDALYGELPKPRNRVKTRQRVKHGKGASISLQKKTPGKNKEA